VAILHDGLPLGLDHEILTDVKSLSDVDEVFWFFVINSLFRSTAHNEVAGLDEDEFEGDAGA
jgi:hypothetical protein